LAVPKDAGNSVSYQGQIPRPFLKWPGGKRRVVPFLLPHLDLPAKRLVEPFCGSCALSLAVADRAGRFWLNDINFDLQNLLSQVRDAPELLLSTIRPLFTPAKNKESVYYRLRDRFNQATNPMERAALFVYLNRHGYNGLCRYNSGGEFNVPFGRYIAPYFPEQEIIAATAIFSRSEITKMDFEAVLDACGLGDTVYCDPPYVPLSETASFTSYSAGGFSLAEQERLAWAVKRAVGRGALAVISNHDTPFTRSLYKRAQCSFIKVKNVRRNISCNGDNRGFVREIIAVFRPDN